GEMVEIGAWNHVQFGVRWHLGDLQELSRRDSRPKSRRISIRTGSSSNNPDCCEHMPRYAGVSKAARKRSSHDRRDSFTRAAQLGRLGPSPPRLSAPEPPPLRLHPPPP